MHYHLIFFPAGLHNIMATKSVRPEQVQKAVAALLKFVGQQDQTSLLEEDELLHLVRVPQRAAPPHACRCAGMRLAKLALCAHLSVSTNFTMERRWCTARAADSLARSPRLLLPPPPACLPPARR